MPDHVRTSQEGIEILGACRDMDELRSPCMNFSRTLKSQGDDLLGYGPVSITGLYE